MGGGKGCPLRPLAALLAVPRHSIDTDRLCNDLYSIEWRGWLAIDCD